MKDAKYYNKFALAILMGVSVAIFVMPSPDGEGGPPNGGGRGEVSKDDSTAQIVEIFELEGERK